MCASGAGSSSGRSNLAARTNKRTVSGEGLADRAVAVEANLRCLLRFDDACPAIAGCPHRVGPIVGQDIPFLRHIASLGLQTDRVCSNVVGTSPELLETPALLNKITSRSRARPSVTAGSQ